MCERVNVLWIQFNVVFALFLIHMIHDDMSHVRVVLVESNGATLVRKFLQLFGDRTLEILKKNLL